MSRADYLKSEALSRSQISLHAELKSGHVRPAVVRHTLVIVPGTGACPGRSVITEAIFSGGSFSDWPRPEEEHREIIVGDVRMAQLFSSGAKGRELTSPAIFGGGRRVVLESTECSHDRGGSVKTDPRYR